jgi:hypothetical protein
MAEIVACPSCQRKLQIPEQFFGQKVQCPECREMFVAAATSVSAQPIPATSVPSPAPAPAPPVTRRPYEDDPRDIDIRRRRRYDDDYDDFDEFDRPGRMRHRYAPHRGGLVIALGIISLVAGFTMCLPFFLGPVAWALGSYDLREMRDGRMDPSGEGMTRAGLICGMLSTIFLMLGILFIALMILSGA